MSDNEELQEQLETIQEVLETIEEKLEEKPAEVKKPKTHTVELGDTWASLGKKYAPKGVTGFAYAQTLMAKNGSKLTVGAKVEL